jgi:hypothetical protein
MGPFVLATLGREQTAGTETRTAGAGRDLWPCGRRVLNTQDDVAKLDTSMIGAGWPLALVGYSSRTTPEHILTQLASI